MHTARRNIDMTYIVMNNEIYGLTTGQASPTSMMGAKTKSTPFGDIESPLNSVSLAISSGATYVARAFAGEPAQLAELIKNGITHKGFAIIDVLSPCVSFNNLNTYDWFRKRVYKLDQSHDPSDRNAAILKAMECESSGWDKIPIGLFYQASRPVYSELDVALKKGPLIRQPMPTRDEISGVMDEYK